MATRTRREREREPRVLLRQDVHSIVSASVSGLLATFRLYQFHSRVVKKSHSSLCSLPHPYFFTEMRTGFALATLLSLAASAVASDVIEVSSANFEATIAGPLVLVGYTAPW